MQAHLEAQALKYVLEKHLTCRQADKLFEAGQFGAAKEKYFSEAVAIVGKAFTLPSTPGQDGGGVISDSYINLDLWKRTNLTGCCLGMARCLRRENLIEMALAWLEEVSAIYRSEYHIAKDPLYDWEDVPFLLPELTFLRTASLCLASEIFISLGNTGTGTTRRYIATSVPEKHETRELNRLLNEDLLIQMLQTRHPDPQATLKEDLVSPLQVRGSWKKIQVSKTSSVTEGRESFSSFIWNSYFYVAGGRKSSLGPWYRDMWALDLRKPDAWRQLPDYPRKIGIAGVFIGWNMLVHRDKALLFTGRPLIDVFDLAKEKWSSFETTYSPTEADIEAGVVSDWPYPNEKLSDTTMQIVKGKLYVFGGAHATTSIGCNLFMVLDLSSRKWRRLSGYVRAPKHADYTCPGPRKSSSSWVSTDKTRIFLLFGHCDRQGASFHDEVHGSDEAYAYDDMWSWSIQDERWRRERMSGNPPCARTEMACVYNEKLQKTIVFGGYHPTLPTIVLDMKPPVQFQYSYFADTFIYDTVPSVPAVGSEDIKSEPTLSAPKWKQVMTPGFPTYRCQGQLACDPSTGRTYLFGGFTSSQYIPTRSKLISRSFGDIWELRMDEPGGHFDEVNVQEEARIARAGPWQRCFSCAAAGPWKKCGGSCNGRVFFCGVSCLKEGWKEHKTMHRCTT